MYLEAIGVWTLFTVLVVFTATVGLLIASVLLIISYITRLFWYIKGIAPIVDAVYDRKLLHKLEDSLVRIKLGDEYYSYVSHDYKDIVVNLRGENVNVNLHSIKCSKGKVHDHDKESIVYIHGANDSSVNTLILTGLLREILDSDRYNAIYGIDLPGFGRSTCSVSQKLTNDVVEELISESIRQFICINKIEKVYLLGHSFGGYHVVNFGYKYPNLVNKLMIVNAAGLLPTLGSDGMYMAYLFSWGIPGAQYRLLGNLGLFIHYTMYQLFRAPLKDYYIYQLLGSPDNFGYNLVGSYITKDGVQAYWNKPNYHKFLQLKIPVAICYGEIDTIMPVHQGIVMSCLIKNSCPIYVIQNSWHIPMYDACAFSFAVNLASDDAACIRKQFPNLKLTSDDVKHFAEKFRSNFSLKETSEVVAKTYDYLHYNLSMDTSICPDVVMIQTTTNNGKQVPSSFKCSGKKYLDSRVADRYFSDQRMQNRK